MDKKIISLVSYLQTLEEKTHIPPCEGLLAHINTKFYFKAEREEIAK